MDRGEQALQRVEADRAETLCEVRGQPGTRRAARLVVEVDLRVLILMAWLLPCNLAIVLVNCL